MDISKRFNPKEIEDKWYRFWEEKGYFSGRVNPEKEPYSIVIPPPNVTGILHMGHALNNTIQDILIRYQRMRGREALWIPGTDHAGIATQNIVEKEIARQGLRRQDLGRDRFLKRVWEWKEEYGSTIIHQLKKLGVSCDWSRTRFTMDNEYSYAVREVFVRLYNKGLIYRGNYIINWCPRCQTALSDEEAPHREIEGFLYYIRYPLKKAGIRSSRSAKRNFKRVGLYGDYIVVATTRPETMLGDTAVAVNPRDARYRQLIGETLILPLINRQITIIADNIVDKEFGTGAVKVTPAHDPNDYLLAKKHKLDFINIMHPDGSLNDNAGDYKGMDRFQARKVILDDLKRNNLLERVEPHRLSAGHCYRCNTIIEPYLSRQWFVKMKPLAKPAIDVVRKGKIRFYPVRWKKVYLNWMENIQDWCISRQIWWGHRLPVYYCRDCQRESAEALADSLPTLEMTKSTGGRDSSVGSDGVIVSTSTPANCPVCGSGDIYQEEDVLDTWFSSWLWPFATFYWPRSDYSMDGSSPMSDLSYFYPTSALVTAPEILFFWVARMIMAGIEFMGDIPFRDVYIHGTVRDISGRKMSKSLGNAIDPLEIISEYGADALRFCLASSASQGDLFLAKEKFEMGRNFANKIWNAARFVLMNLEPSETMGDLCASFKENDLRLIDRWVLSRFYSMLKEVNRYLDDYRFSEAANLMYAFFWHEFCDWYLEIAKNNLRQKSTQLIMYKVLEKMLRILHPFIPFITEEIWHLLPHARESVMIQRWPHVQDEMIDKDMESQVGLLFEIIKTIRNLRSQIELKPERKAVVSIYLHAKARQQLIRENSDLIVNLGRLESLEVLGVSGRPQGTISSTTGEADIYLHFSGLVDINKERNRIKERRLGLDKMVKVKEQRLKNTEFVKKAPPPVVAKEREDVKKLKDESERLEKMLRELH